MKQTNNQETINTCKNCRYLETKNNSGRTEKEIEHPIIIKGKQIAGCRNSVLWSKQIHRARKRSSLWI